MFVLKIQTKTSTYENVIVLAFSCIDTIYYLITYRFIDMRGE